MDRLDYGEEVDQQRAQFDLGALASIDLTEVQCPCGVRLEETDKASTF